MQDKNQYRELVEKGWADMATRLDTIMPVARQSRNRFLLVLILGLLILSGAAVTYFLISQVDSGESKKVPLADILETPDTSPSNQEVTNVLPDENPSPAVAFSESSATLNTGGDIQSAGEGRHISQDWKGTMMDEGNIQNRMENADLLKALVDNNTDKELVISKMYGEESMQSDRAAVTAAKIKGLVPADLEMSAGDLSSTLFAEIEPASERHLQRGIDLAFTAGAHTTLNTPLKGFDAGILITKKLGRRWGIETGLLFGLYGEDGLKLGLGRANYSETSLSLPENEYNGHDPVQFDLVSNNEAYGIISQISDRYHYLHVPVMASYLLSSRLALNFGPRFSYLFNAYSKYSPGSFDNTTGQLHLTAKKDNFIYDYDYVRKFNLAAVAGVDYRLGAHGSLRLEYTRSLTPTINRRPVPNRTDFLNTLRFGFVYTM